MNFAHTESSSLMMFFVLLIFKPSFLLRFEPLSRHPFTSPHRGERQGWRALGRHRDCAADEWGGGLIVIHDAYTTASYIHTRTRLRVRIWTKCAHATCYPEPVERSAKTEPTSESSESERTREAVSERTLQCVQEVADLGRHDFQDSGSPPCRQFVGIFRPPLGAPS